MSLNIPEFSEILSKMETAFLNALGSDVNFDESGPLGQQTMNLSLSYQELYQLLQAVYSASRVDQATGKYLDDLVALSGIKRSDGLKTVVKSCTLTGTDATIIPKGSKVKDADGIFFESVAEATISGTTATVDFVSVDFGAFNVPVGSLTTIVDAVTGWTSITNSNIGVDGQDGQDDGQLRNWILTRSNNGSISTPGAIRAEIEGVTDVLQAYVYANYSSTTGPAPHNAPRNSVMTVVQYSDTTIESDIAQALFNTLSCAGTENTTSGGATYAKQSTVTYSNGDLVVKWTQALETPINFIVELIQNSTFTAEDEQNLNETIQKYIQGNALIGAPFYYSKIYAEIINSIGDAIVESVYISRNTVPAPSDTVDLDANFWEVFVAGTVVISYGI